MIVNHENIHLTFPYVYSPQRGSLSHAFLKGLANWTPEDRVPACPRFGRGAGVEA